MTSILTNGPAMHALQTLRNVEVQDGVAQQVMASGVRVSHARDNPAYWSIATTMRADLKAMKAARDGVSVALGIVDTAYATNDLVISNLSGITSDLLLGKNSVSAPQRSLDRDILSRASIISSAIRSAGFNGVNLLYRKASAPTSLSFTMGVQRRSDGVFAVQKKVLDLSTIAFIDDVSTAGILSKRYVDRYGATSGRRLFADSGPPIWQVSLFPTFGRSTQSAFPTSTINGHIDIVAQMQNNAINVYTQLRVMKDSLERQLKMMDYLSDIQTKGLDQLVDADLTAMSAQRRSIEARRQLATQALHIANAAPSRLLQLYRPSRA